MRTPPAEQGSADSAGVSARLVDGIRSAARRVRRLPDRLLHPLRRRRARRRLRESSPVGPVLFVCHGNICRSPYAEAVFRRRARGRSEVASVGLTGPDRPSPETAREVARERGVDLGDHRSRLVTEASLVEVDVVVVMDPRQARSLRTRFGFRGSLVLGDFDPGPVRRRPIRDPVFQPPDVFHEVYARIDRCVDGMLDAMGLPRGEEPDAAGDGSGAVAGGSRPTRGRDTA